MITYLVELHCEGQDDTTRAGRIVFHAGAEGD